MSDEWMAQARSFGWHPLDDCPDALKVGVANTRAFAAEAALAAVTEERDAAEARFAEMHRLAGEYLLQRDAVAEERDRLAADLIGAEVVLRNLLVLIRGDRLAWASGFRKDASDWLDRRARAVLSDPSTPEPCEACGQTLVQGFIPVVGGGTHRHPDYPDLEFARCPVCGGTGVLSDPTTPEAQERELVAWVQDHNGEWNEADPTTPEATQR